MSKEIYISSTPHETRLAIVENDDLTEIYYERENEYTLAGSIYNGKVTRVLPGMQSSFVDIGLERDAFLYITDFLEEAGDSAEFDAGETGERRGRGRGDRGGRSGRGETSGEETAAPSTEGEPSARGDRRGRGRSRDERGEALRTEPQAAGETLPEALIDSGSALAGAANAETEADSAATGETGAEGSRRWRGRRGRRRGRGTAAREDGQVPAQHDDESGMSGEAQVQAEAGDPAASEERIELGAAAEDRAADDAFDSGARLPEPVQQEAAYGDEARPYGDPDGGRGRGRGDRGGRRDRDGRGSRAPRDFSSSSRSSYGIEDEGESAAAPGGEPILLPGESLAKYRQGEGSAAEPATNEAATAPAARADFVLPGAWSGGAVMPGETLRPRTGDAGASRPDRGEGGFEDRGNRGSRGARGDRGGRGDRRPEGDQRRERPAFSGGESASHPTTVAAPVPLSAPRERISPLETMAEFASLGEPAGVLEAGPAVAGLAERSVTDPGSPSAASPSAEGHGVAEIAGEWAGSVENQAETQAKEQPAPAAVDPAMPSAGTVSGEYEPTEGSASHRFDPAPPREYRHTVADPETETGGDAATTEESETAPSASTSTHLITPPAGAALRPLGDAHPAQHDASLSSPAAAEIEDERPAHEFTAVTSGGDMLSEQTVPQPQEIAGPTAPIHHETVVLEEEPVSGAGLANASAVSLTDQDEAFARYQPEMEGEEDFQATTLHASAIEEMEYDEEETLEGAADLGTMIREMSIDEITAPGDESEDDAGFDEEEVAFDEQDATGETEDDAHFEESEPRVAGETVEENGAEDFEGEPQRIGGESAANGNGSAAREEAFQSRRHGRRDGRRSDRGGERRDERARNTGGSGERSTGIRQGRRDHRHSAQTTNLPAISDLLKPGQELLVQIAKEPIAKKGARITSHIALPGRFLVFMPTVNHTGVSRKIESDGERRRLKEILLSEKGDAAGGFIVRTAASGASEDELRSDLRFLLNLWADIKQRSESSKSPALIYHDLNLVERILRDQVTDNFSAIWVDTEGEYERVLRFLQRFQPSLIRRVKLYSKDTPLFEQFGLQEEVNKALRSKVWLKSGGSIVINQTEALVAIDINTGKYVGKTARLEDTIVKTNLDAIPEIVRQIRLRDLGGIIIIDFIDMDERKNRHRVMAVLEEELKKDRAPSKVLQFNDFGLVAITRKRVKQSLERTLSTTCGVCTGTGMVKSPVTVCNEIYVEMRKMQKHLDRGDVMLRVNPEVVKQLKSPTAKWLQEMEDMLGKTILVKSDPTLHPEQYDIH